MKAINICLILFILASCQVKKNSPPDFPLIETDTLKLYPATYEKLPDIPSPMINSDHRELVLTKLKNGMFAFFDVSVESKGIRDVIHRQDNKGDQLRVNGKDFQRLLRNGLHNQLDLEKTLSITGRSIAEITVDAWPGSASWAGFLCKNETIISRLIKDNNMVRQMGLTHRELAYPIFHCWNLIKEYEIINNSNGLKDIGIEGIYYTDEFLPLTSQGGKGWQTSIFNDSLTGSYHVRIRNEESPFGEVFISDLAPYYIQRYGFYEGMTSYRLDPRNIAISFGLKTIDEINGLSLMPESGELELCPGGYIPQDSLWTEFHRIMNRYKGKKDSIRTHITDLYPNTLDPLRRLCCGEILNSDMPDRLDFLLKELSVTHWESDTLSANNLIIMGEMAIPGLTNIFMNSQADSLVRWRALNTLRKIKIPVSAAILNMAEEDESWIILKEAEFIRSQQMGHDEYD
ncbi:MAG: hypothetical protein U9N86_10950 [Bacteroidota bacterium]|nr:hypothetical protein [Bacteroidota bacterium]